MMNDDTVVS